MAEIIYGKQTVSETILAGHKVLELYLNKDFKDQEFITLAKQKGIKINFVDRNKLSQLTTGNHQGVIAKIADFKYYEIDDILLAAKNKGEEPFVIILDGLEDPHNLGAILRTAEAAGVHGVIIPKNRSVSLNATVAKLSVGAINYIKVSRVTNITQTIKELKDKGLWVIGTDLNTNTNYDQIDYQGATAIVIGNEGKGISRLVKENCDVLVKIPMIGKIQSLNASVSAGVMIYEVVRQRLK